VHAAALTYFRETARQGSIRRAAAKLNVAASALNRQVLKLEAELGTPLFDRLPGGMRLTAAGELLLQHVVATLHDFDGLRARIDDLRAARSGHVAIAAIDSLLVDFLPRAVDQFRRDFPAVTHALDAVAPAEVPRIVAAGEADIDPDFARFRASLRPRLVSNSIQALKLAIRLHMGIAFFTRLGFLDEIARGEVVWRPFESAAVNALRIGLLVPVGRQQGAPAQQMTRLLTEELARLKAR